MPDLTSQTDTVRFTMEIGLLYRRGFRATLDTEGIRWTEHKGLVDSVFVITCTKEDKKRLLAWVEKVNEDAAQAEWDRKVAGRSKRRPNAWCRICGAKTSIFATAIKTAGGRAYPAHRSCKKNEAQALTARGLV